MNEESALEILKLFKELGSRPASAGLRQKISVIERKHNYKPLLTPQGKLSSVGRELRDNIDALLDTIRKIKSAGRYSARQHDYALVIGSRIWTCTPTTKRTRVATSTK